MPGAVYTASFTTGEQAHASPSLLQRLRGSGNLVRLGPILNRVKFGLLPSWTALIVP